MKELLTLHLDIEKAQFTEQLVATLGRGGVGLQDAITTAVKAGISQRLEQHIASGNCLRYEFKNGGQSRIMSLKDAVDHSGFDFWYLDIQVDLQPGIIITEHGIESPSVLQWLPIDYGSGVQKTIKFKHITMKTRERYNIQILHPRVPDKLLESVLLKLGKECVCSSQHLVPIPAGPWEWQQPFGCVICGKRYFCECFHAAIDKFYESERQQCYRETDSEEEQENTVARPEANYRAGICHLCMGRPSNLLYCSPMYGSTVKVHYGAYIENFAISEGLSAHAAENKVRDILGVPRIGEGWISETQLFNLVKMLFIDYEILREARPNWLGSQRLDIFIPDISLAIEYQGEQHFKPVERFGGQAAFHEGQQRDKRKRLLCKENGVELVYFTYAEDLSVERVEKKLSRFLPT